MVSKPSYAELEARIKTLENQVSDLRAMTAENQNIRRFHRIIKDVANIAVQGYDENRRVIFWNQASCDLYGYTEKEALGRKLEDLIIPPAMAENVKDLVRRWVEKGEKVPPGEVVLMGKNNRPVPVYSSHVMVQTPKGKELFCIDIDLSPLKQAEKETLEAEKLVQEHRQLALVGQIAGKMAHDFNNILGVIMGNAELSLMNFEPLEAKNVLKLVVNQALRGKNLTKNLAAFAKPQEPRQEFFNVSEKLDFVLSLLAEELKGITVGRENAPNIPDLLADPAMIEHCLVNLIQNAVHAVSTVACPRIDILTRVAGTKPDEQIRIHIRDNGCGIPMEHVDRVFEPSFTLKGSLDETGSYREGIKGTGYGLANVKKYIEQHRGSIVVESVFRAGTTFTMSLPVVLKKLTREEESMVRTHGDDQAKKNILLVEDETAISDIQYRLLSNDPFRHRVDIAPSGRSAMDLFDRNHYDLVSLDYILSGQANGMDVYRHIRRQNKDLPILFVSGNIEFLESIRELTREDERIDHLTKPCSNREYLDRVVRLLKKAHQ